MEVNGEFVDASFARKLLEDIYSRLILLLVGGMLRGEVMYNETNKLRERYRLQFSYFAKPTEFVNPENQCRVMVSFKGSDISNPFLVNLYDNTGFVSDLSVYYRDVAISEICRPSETNPLKPPLRYWYDHINGDLNSVTLLNHNYKCISYHRSFEGKLKVTHGEIPLASLPDNLARCKNLLGEPIPFRVDPSQQLYNFLVRAGLLQLQEDILRIWPCKKCRKPKSSHKGNAIKGYEPYLIS